MAEPSLYERLGGVFAIAAVVNHFSDAVVQNPIVGQGSKNPELDEWSTNQVDRLPGLKFMRTLWVRRRRWALFVRCHEAREHPPRAGRGPSRPPHHPRGVR